MKCFSFIDFIEKCFYYVFMFSFVVKRVVIICRFISTNDFDKMFHDVQFNNIKMFFRIFRRLTSWSKNVFAYINFFNDCSKYVSVVSLCDQYWAINTKFIIAQTKFRTLFYWIMKNKIIIDIIYRTIVFCSTSIHCLTLENFENVLIS